MNKNIEQIIDRLRKTLPQGWTIKIIKDESGIVELEIFDSSGKSCGKTTMVCPTN